VKSNQIILPLVFWLVPIALAPAAVRYVDLNSAAPTPPYINWSTAARNVQDAVDVAIPGDEIIVTNGVYVIGGRAMGGNTTNRVVIDKAVTVRSVNGPQATVIEGLAVGEGIRCVYVGSNAVLSGFTLTKGYAARSGGGGAWCEASGVLTNCTLTGNATIRDGGGAYGGTLNNCILVGNRAFYRGGGVSGSVLNNCFLTGNSVDGDDFVIGGGAYRATLNNCTLTGNWAGEVNFGFGGGAYYCTLNNCTLRGNSASSTGGGAYGGTLNNCIVVGNSANTAGGAVYATLNNCIVYFNTSPNDANYASVVMNYSCTTPMPTVGVGNITNAPLLVDTSAWVNLHLQSNSPCINSGFNAFAPAGPDLDGHPRIAGGGVDIGAYEFQFPASVLSYAWAQHHGLPTDGSADYSDDDGDGHNAWQEWRAGTNPTDAQSALRMLLPTSSVAGVTVQWQSVSNRTYFLERANNLGIAPPFSLLTSNLLGLAGTTSYIDTSAVGPGPFFYRVGVQP
jgi:hypothetical protein